MPTKRAGTFSLWGIGGVDHSTQAIQEDKKLWITDFDRITYEWDTYMGTLGLNHQITIGESNYLVSTLGYSFHKNKMNTLYVEDDFSTSPDMDLAHTNQTLSVEVTLNHKFNAKTTLRSGIAGKGYFYDYQLGGTQFYVPGTYEQLVNSTGNTFSLELYAQLKHSFSNQLSTNLGLHGQYFAQSEEYLIEPRIGVEYKPSARHTLSLGYGLHSRPEALQLYFLELDGKLPNSRLRLSKAHHLIGGYEWLIKKDFRFRAEAYYQHLYDVPGEEGTSFAMLNFKQNHTLNKVLVNNTIGRNIGLDLTLEQAFANRFYYMLTGSIFDAKYKGGDGVWRNTRYNKRFVANLLAGKEFVFSNGKHLLDVNGRITVIGGECYSPVLEAESKQAQRIIYDETRAFTEQFPAFVYGDISVNYRINHKCSSSVISLSVKNVLGQKVTLGHNYNFITGEIDLDKRVMTLPNLSYKLEF